MTDKLVLIFTRNPELGKVKTRLAKTIGEQSALNIYTFLLQHTERIVRSTSGDKAVYYSEKIRSKDIWDSTIYQKFLQKGEDLGIRMRNAFKQGFEHNYQKIVIVGSDLFDLNSDLIESAFEQLENHDVVLGPAEDGGYYLLGMNTLHEAVFQNKDWGTSTVFNDTIKDLQNKRVFLLKTLNDVDTYDDIKDNNTLKSFVLQND